VTTTGPLEPELGVRHVAAMPARAAQLAALDRRLKSGVSAERPLGVLVVRILRQREFNLLFGYEFGLHLVIEAMARLRAVLRPVDHVELVGDGEFVVVLPDLVSPNHALLAALRVVRAFREPLPVQGHGMFATVKVGAAVAPLHGDNADTLCRSADIAYGEAQVCGTHAALFDPDGHRPLVTFGQLRAALESGRLVAHLQPIWDLRTRRIVGAESLARWQSDILGAVSPEIFVPLAEQTGLIGDLTRWSLTATLRHAGQARLHERGMRFSVNLSPRVFLEQSFGDQMLAALRIWDVPPETITLEVTEGAVMEDPEHSAQVLQRMSAEGMHVSIDDFGTGYSSFAYLRQFPANEIKIDRSFVRDIVTDERSARLVVSMIELAHRLDMRVVAEGVEDDATLTALTGMGCDLAQGFHLGRPRPAEEFVAGLSEP
jgi:predicted signal transduction protein with EAL and GGDEF domain